MRHFFAAAHLFFPRSTQPTYHPSAAARAFQPSEGAAAQHLCGLEFGCCLPCLGENSQWLARGRTTEEQASMAYIRGWRSTVIFLRKITALHFPLPVGDTRRCAHHAFQRHSANSYLHYINRLGWLESALSSYFARLGSAILYTLKKRNSMNHPATCKGRRSKSSQKKGRRSKFC